MLRFIVIFLFFSALHTLCDAQGLKLEHVRTFNGHSHGVRRVVFAPGGNNFASGGTRGELFIWNIDGDGSVKKLEGHLGSIIDVRYAKNGKHLISAGEDGMVKVWDVATGQCVQKIVSPTGGPNASNKLNFATMSLQSSKIYFGGVGGFLCQVDFDSKAQPEVLYSDPKDPIQCAILSPDGNELIFAAGRYLLALDLKTGKVVREYNTGNCIINSLEFSSDGTKLLSWCADSRVDIRKPSNFYLITSFRSGTGERKFSNMAFTDDQKQVITVDHASRFNMWDLETKKIALDQWAEQGTVMTFDLASGPKYVLSGSLDKSIKLWRIVPNVLEETKKKQKVEPQQVIEPDVEIISYAEPVEDVKQIEQKVMPVVVQKPVATQEKPVIAPEPIVKTEPVVVPKPVVKTEPVKVITEPVEVKVVAETRPEPIAIAVPTVKRDSIVSELPETKNQRRIKPIRKEHRLLFKSHLLTFEIWDAQVIDGDIVSIYVDDKCIVDEYSITATKKVVTFDASSYKRVYLYLHAHNLGTISPNTVTMTISDGSKLVQIELRSDLTGSSAVEITFED